MIPEPKVRAVEVLMFPSVVPEIPLLDVITRVQSDCPTNEPVPVKLNEPEFKVPAAIVSEATLPSPNKNFPVLVTVNTPGVFNLMD